MLISPRPGALRDTVLATLQRVHLDASNLRSAVAASAYERLLGYLGWVTDATRLLQEQASTEDVDRLIQTRRYYALLGSCGTLAGSAPERLVTASTPERSPGATPISCATCSSTTGS